ncbi:MAG: hypothetical protein ABFC38_05240 [Methanospirillum sp.]
MFAIRFYRVYDTGHEIDLAALEATPAAAGTTARASFVRVSPKSIWIEHPPLLVRLPPVSATAGGTPYVLAAVARVYEIGAISLCFVLEDAPAPAQALLPVALSFAGQRGLDQAFLDTLAVLRDVLGPELGVRPLDTAFYEDYTVYVVDRDDPAIDPVALLAGEEIQFSESTREEVLRNTLSYTTNDRAVLAWDAALLVAPEPPADLAEVIEYAVVQVLELRYYDRVLTLQMQRMYDDLEAGGRFGRFRRRRGYDALLNRLMETYAEVSEVTEGIENLIRITEDVYYARVYATALRVLRADQWRASVDRKIDVIRENYQMLSDEVNREHDNFLEWVIIVLIALEFAFAIWEAFRA